jgi:hypothetical protein
MKISLSESAPETKSVVSPGSPSPKVAFWSKFPTTTTPPTPSGRAATAFPQSFPAPPAFFAHSTAPVESWRTISASSPPCEVSVEAPTFSASQILPVRIVEPSASPASQFGTPRFTLGCRSGVSVLPPGVGGRLAETNAPVAVS